MPELDDGFLRWWYGGDPPCDEQTEFDTRCLEGSRPDRMSTSRVIRDLRTRPAPSGEACQVVSALSDSGMRQGPIACLGGRN